MKLTWDQLKSRGRWGIWWHWKRLGFVQKPLVTACFRVQIPSDVKVYILKPKLFGTAQTEIRMKYSLLKNNRQISKNWKKRSIGFSLWKTSWPDERFIFQKAAFSKECIRFQFELQRYSKEWFANFCTIKSAIKNSKAVWVKCLNISFRLTLSQTCKAKVNVHNNLMRYAM